MEIKEKDMERESYIYANGISTPQMILSELFKRGDRIRQLEAENERLTAHCKTARYLLTIFLHAYQSDNRPPAHVLDEIEDYINQKR